MPFVEGKGLVYTQPVYDTVHIPAAGTVANFFTIPQGQVLTGAILKNNAHTNLVQAGRLELGNELKVTAITAYVRQSTQAGALPTIADIKAVFAGDWRFVIGGATQFLVIPAQNVPAGPAGYVFASDVGAANPTGFYLTNGIPAFQNKFILDEPIVLKNQESFTMILENFDVVAAPVQITCVLWGTYLRPVR